VKARRSRMKVNKPRYWIPEGKVITPKKDYKREDNKKIIHEEMEYLDEFCRIKE
jgi:hypothetical protein